MLSRDLVVFMLVVIYISMLTSMLHSSVLVYYVLVVCWCISPYYLLVGLLLVMEFPMMLVMELLMLLVIEILMLCISPAVGLELLISCSSSP